MSAENPFLKPPADDSTVKTPPSLIEVINAVSAMLLEQRRFDRQTFTNFKKLFDESGLKWWIIAAGIGGLCELVRIGADILSYFRASH